MPKDKERTVNPAQAQRQKEKQKALKKGKAEVQARRNERLARQNPARIQRQIDDLKAAEESGEPLRPRDKERLEGLQKELAAVKKAREALGDKAPKFGSGERRHGPNDDRSSVLGKRRRDGPNQWKQHDDSSDTDDDVRDIPMPRDTPPPIPRPHHGRRKPNANTEPLGGRPEGRALPQKPPVTQPKAVYESAPVIRNLRQEAVQKFVPAAVRQKLQAAKGKGGLVEPEEMDRLEKEGYLNEAASTGPAQPSAQAASSTTDADAAAARLAEEEERFNREIKSVQIEEVEDEDL